MRPTAMGMDVVPTWSREMKSVTKGQKVPIAMPRPMAMNIQSVR